MKEVKKKFNVLAIVTLVICILSILLPEFIISDEADLNVNNMLILYAYYAIVGILVTILSIIAKKQIKKKQERGKVLSIITMIIGIISIVGSLFGIFFTAPMTSVEVNDEAYCDKVKDCVENGDGTSECMNTDLGIKLKCTTSKLKGTAVDEKDNK